MFRRIKLGWLVLSILTISLLSGCTSDIWNRYPPHRETVKSAIMGAAGGVVIGGIASGGFGAGIGLLTGGILGASFGNILESHYSLIEKLQYNGVEVIVVGDEIKLILPSDRFFTAHSPQLNINYYPVLNMVGEFLKQFRKVSIKIAGYTDSEGSWRRNLSLSRAQAQHLMIYLWNYGVDTRLIYARGYGEKDAIATNETARGRKLNRRIEITLRKIEIPDD